MAQKHLEDFIMGRHRKINLANICNNDEKKLEMQA